MIIPIYCIYDSWHRVGTQHTWSLAIGDISVSIPSHPDKINKPHLTYQWLHQQCSWGIQPNLPSITAELEE